MAMQFAGTSGGFYTSSDAAKWASIVAYCILVVLLAWNPTPLAEALAAIGILCAFAHASLVYGVKTAAAFALICIVTTFIIENVGSTTGVPFGHYHFAVGADLPHVGVIPIIVGPLWFGMGYFSWIVAASLLDGADRKLNDSVDFVALPGWQVFIYSSYLKPFGYGLSASRGMN